MYKFTYLNASLIKIVEINSKVLKEDLRLILSLFPEDDREFLEIHVAELLQKESIENSLAARPGLKGEASNGIGLYVIKKLVDLLNGKISFESKENKGTKFTPVFPKK